MILLIEIMYESFLSFLISWMGNGLYQFKIPRNYIRGFLRESTWRYGC